MIKKQVERNLYVKRLLLSHVLFMVRSKWEFPWHKTGHDSTICPGGYRLPSVQNYGNDLRTRRYFHTKLQS